MSRNHVRVGAAGLELEVVELVNPQHVDVAGPRVVPDQQVLVAAEQLDQGGAGAGARRVAMAARVGGGGVTAHGFLDVVQIPVKLEVPGVGRRI